MVAVMQGLSFFLVSHQFKTTKQRKNKHYKLISEKIQNPPMEGLCYVKLSIMDYDL